MQWACNQSTHNLLNNISPPLQPPRTHLALEWRFDGSFPLASCCCCGHSSTPQGQPQRSALGARLRPVLAPPLASCLRREGSWNS